MVSGNEEKCLSTAGDRALDARTGATSASNCRIPVHGLSIGT